MASGHHCGRRPLSRCQRYAGHASSSPGAFWHTDEVRCFSQRQAVGHGGRQPLPRGVHRLPYHVPAASDPGYPVSKSKQRPIRNLTRRRLGALLGAVPVLAALPWLSGCSSSRAARHAGPVSDHFDGERFFNPGGAEPRGFMDLARWKLSGNNGKWIALSRSWPPSCTATAQRRRFRRHGHADAWGYPRPWHPVPHSGQKQPSVPPSRSRSGQGTRR